MIWSTCSASMLVPVNEVIELLRPYRSIVLPGFFAVFFVLAFAGIALGSRWYARRTFLAYFFVLLLTFNFIAPVTPLPFISWAHFAEPTSQTVHHDEIRIVDANGNELKIDRHATLDSDGVKVSLLTRAMLEEYDEKRNEKVARHLLEESAKHRQEVMTRSAIDHLRFPSHSLTSTWTPAVLNDTDEFVGVRIYRMTFVTSSGGTEVESYEETLLLEVYPYETTPATSASPNTSPPSSINRTASDATASVVG